MIVWRAYGEIGYDPGFHVGIFSTRSSAMAACEADHKEPLEWSDGTGKYVIEPGHTFYASTGPSSIDTVYIVEPEEVKP